jgi:HD-GYP domain-containing protein (c-di-GMP phosphodiesterase class II)
VDIDNVEPGMVLGRHVYPPGERAGIPLLAAQVVVTEAILQRLRKAQITELVIDDEFSKGIELDAPLSDDTRRTAITVLKNTFAAMDSDGARMAPEQLVAVESTIAMILSEISTRRNLLVCVSDMNLFGGDRMRHALAVVVVGSAIAKQFFREHGWKDFRGQRREDGIEDRMVKLGVGMLLQDIGTLAVPDAIRDKKGLLSASERAIMQQHPLLGLELLEGSELSPLTKVTIAQHHERYDGSGYPRGLSGDDVHDHGQIAAIAEMYTSLCEEQGDGEPAFAPHDAYRIVTHARGRLFRSEIVDAFAAAISPFGVGTTVRLGDGRHGIVAANHSDHPMTPTVRITHDADGAPLSTLIDVETAATGKLKIAEVTPGLPTDPIMRTVAAR